uniref:VWA domain-containing protein n=1 Tax=Paractinoplanes polyasparticus TaxID=2856853 RepID=UPI001C8551E8|nr:VWA domain-containing protein [Actinoplanes polyasparticus]
MSTPGDNTAIIVALQPCDSDAALDTQLTVCREYAERLGREVIAELIVPICLPGAGHLDHDAAREAAVERLEAEDVRRLRCLVLLTPVPVDVWRSWPGELIYLLSRVDALVISEPDDDAAESFVDIVDRGRQQARAFRFEREAQDRKQDDRLFRRDNDRGLGAGPASGGSAPPPSDADYEDVLLSHETLGWLDARSSRTADAAPPSSGSTEDEYYENDWLAHDQPFSAVDPWAADGDPLPLPSRFHIDTVESQGVQVGNSNTQTNYFGAPGHRPPTSERSGPLPHNGLFIRRNNAFGTRSTLGIAELIDQGVLIDQTHIRFDDFIASNTDHIPAPAPGAAVAVSHGTAAVSGALKAHPETTHLVEIALRAGAQSSDGPKTGEPLPVNFVFAVDVSASMWGEKLDQVVVAIRELHARLRDDDVLGIIVFNDQARTLLRATRKADLPADEIGRLIASMAASGGTDLNLGLAFALNEIERFASSKTVNCVYLFSDGDPTSGETDWVKIRANVAARLRGTVTLSCFGFGSDARIPELRALAGISGGHWTFVTQPEEVTLTLSEDLTRRESLAAINIQLRIDIPEETTVWHLYGHDLITDPAGRTAVLAEADAARRRSLKEFGVHNRPDLIRDDEGIRIFAPDLAYGETYWVVLELQTADAAFGGATVQYLDTRIGDNVSHSVDLSAPGAIPVETVLTHGVGLWTSEVTFFALDDLYENDRESAEKRLNQHVIALTAAYDEVPSPQFRDDRVTLVKLVSLAGNLGLRRAWADQPTGGAFGYAVHTMNQFGRVRGGYLTLRGQ